MAGTLIELWRPVWIAITTLAVLQSILFGLQAVEHRRFARGRRRKPRQVDTARRVAVFAPCKGRDLRLEQNLRPLFEQDYQNYKLTFIVESPDDEACPVIERLLRQYPSADARVLIAGRATTSGQKVHNLLVATRDLSPDIEVLAFVDSDARAAPGWLRSLVQRLDDEGVGAATGYRWFLPERPSIANCLLYSINAQVAGLMGPGGHHLVWGGSWAIRRNVADAIGLRQAWSGMLSDDLVATRVLQQAGYNIQYEPDCVLTSSLDVDGTEMFQFLRRQYVIGRIYCRAWWLAALFFNTSGVVGFWGSLVVLVTSLATGHVDLARLAALFAATLYVLQAMRGALRGVLFRLLFVERSPTLRRVIAFDIVAGPFVGLVNWIGMLSSALGRQIRWRNITYRLASDGVVLDVQRPEELAAGPPPPMSARPRASQASNRTGATHRMGAGHPPRNES